MLGIDKYGVAVCTMVKQVSAGNWQFYHFK